MAGERYDEETLGVMPETEADRAVRRALEGQILGRLQVVRAAADGMDAEKAREVLANPKGVSSETRVAAEIALGRTGRGVFGVFARLLGSGSGRSRWSKHDEM